VLADNDRAARLYRADGWVPDGTTREDEVWGAGARIERWVRRLGDEPHLPANREVWDRQAPWYAEAQRGSWLREPSWGIFGIPDAVAGVLPHDLAGVDVVELGCGTGYVSAWCLRRGAATAVGVDASAAQLATAAAQARHHDVPVRLVLADAERAPLASGSFDLAISEYGAAIWCDPRRWIPEAARLLRPDGRLVFLGNSTLVVLCAPDFEDRPAGDRLLRPQRGMHRFEWPDTGAVEFHVSHGEMVRTLRGAGFEVLDLIELYAEPGATTPYPFVDASWASRWPVEEVWVARRR
jgi:SAM-dependent methyltransferase